VLLPAVREASAETMIIGNGFSCREQIHQLTGRRAHHLAEVVGWLWTRPLAGLIGTWSTPDDDQRHRWPFAEEGYLPGWSYHPGPQMTSHAFPGES
jgi:hypothetical protein